MQATFIAPTNPSFVYTTSTVDGRENSEFSDAKLLSDVPYASLFIMSFESRTSSSISLSRLLSTIFVSTDGDGSAVGVLSVGNGVISGVAVEHPLINISTQIIIEINIFLCFFIINVLLRCLF